MTDPTSPAPARRRWSLSFTKLRLGVLMSALVFGITGMLRNQAILFDVGIGFAILGVGMRIWNRYRRR